MKTAQYQWLQTRCYLGWQRAFSFFSHSSLAACQFLPCQNKTFLWHESTETTWMVINLTSQIWLQTLRAIFKNKWFVCTLAFGGGGEKKYMLLCLWGYCLESVQRHAPELTLVTVNTSIGHYHLQMIGWHISPVSQLNTIPPSSLWQA